MGNGFVAAGCLTVPGSLIWLREAQLSARGEHILNIHSSGVATLFAMCSFYFLLGWVMTGIVLSLTGVARGKRETRGELSALACGAMLMVLGLWQS
jgi:hypothetical protein